MEEIGEHGGGGARANQSLGLEGLNVGASEPFGFGIEQPPPGSPGTVVLQSAFERDGLEQDRETGQRAFSDWCARE
jgi:hypothetical protein